MKINIVFFTCWMLMFSCISAFGYSFHCEKYARASVVQSCLQEEAKYRRECNNRDDCMRGAHELLITSWAKYNLDLKEGGSRQQRTKYYDNIPAKHITEEEKYQRHIKNEIYRTKVNTRKAASDLFLDFSSYSMNMNVDNPSYYDTAMANVDISNNYNKWHKIFSEEAAIALIVDEGKRSSDITPGMALDYMKENFWNIYNANKQ